MISFQELNPKGHGIAPEYLENAFRLYYVLNVIRDRYKNPILVSRAFSTPAEQAEINPDAKNSAHTTWEAADLVTPNRSQGLWLFLMENYEDLVLSLDLYLEEKLYTPNHVHVQTRRVPSGNRIFKP